MRPSGDCAWSRRAVLASAGSLVATGLAGCLGANSESVSVLAAGSLARTFEDHIGPAFADETGSRVAGEYFGTNAIMQMVEDRTSNPDVVVSADATLLRDRLYGSFTDWDVEFATNSVGLGYNPDTGFGQRIENGVPWYEAALETDAGDIAIGDPDLDPLGYRALQAFELVEDELDLDGFRERMLDLVYEEPTEPKLVATVETGSRAGAILYRNMAVDHGLSFHEFPDRYNFASAALADHYASAEYTTADGYTAEGRPVVYNATVVDGADRPEAGRELVQFLVDNPGILMNGGLTVDEPIPRTGGTAPGAISL